MGLDKSHILPASVIGVATLAAVFGEPGRLLLRYDRVAIADGELWRLLSGHIAHLGWSHLLFNVLGLLLIWYLLGRELNVVQWLLVLLISIAGIDAGFFAFDNRLEWYVGLSGVLHGLLAAGVVAGLSVERRDLQILAVVVLLKLGYEQFGGALPGSSAVSGGPVIVAAHLYGAVAGAVAGAIMRRSKAMSPSAL